MGLLPFFYSIRFYAGFSSGHEASTGMRTECKHNIGPYIFAYVK